MHSFAWWPTLIVLAVACFTDLRSHRIPNWLVLPFLLAGIVVSGWLQGWHGLGQSFAGLGLGVLIYGFLFWLGGMGAGDVKLCAAIGAWIPYRKRDTGKKEAGNQLPARDCAAPKWGLFNKFPDRRRIFPAFSAGRDGGAGGVYVALHFASLS